MVKIQNLCAVLGSAVSGASAEHRRLRHRGAVRSPPSGPKLSSAEPGLWVEPSTPLPPALQGALLPAHLCGQAANQVQGFSFDGLKSTFNLVLK